MPPRYSDIKHERILEMINQIVECCIQEVMTNWFSARSGWKGWKCSSVRLSIPKKIMFELHEKWRWV